MKINRPKKEVPLIDKQLYHNIDLRNKDSIDKFFKLTNNLTRGQQAALLGISYAKLKTLIKKSTTEKFRITTKPQQAVYPKDCINDEKWLWDIFFKQGMSIKQIARLTNTKDDEVFTRIAKFNNGFKRNRQKSDKNSQPLSPFRTEEWMYYHYATREDYLLWCQKNTVEPDEHGGQGLSHVQCARLAGVSPRTMFDWAIKFNMRQRDPAESRVLLNEELSKNSTRQEKIDKHLKRIEQYRNGNLPIIINVNKSMYIFQNGKLLGSRALTAQKIDRDFEF